MQLPAIVAHADWAVNPRKRWVTPAILNKEGVYELQLPEPVNHPTILMHRLRQIGRRNYNNPTVFLGVDFPIGLPKLYADRVKIEDFMDALLGFGIIERWRDFYHVAEQPEEIDLYRPFYPQRPGASKREHIVDRLGLEEWNNLWRECERASEQRRAAAPLFWTMGAQQVGKAAISGWCELLVPALRDAALDCGLWPFEGNLFPLLQSKFSIIAEAYPTEFYAHLQLNVANKRSQEVRKANAPILQAWARANSERIKLSNGLNRLLECGFGDSAESEDKFDATVGLIGTLNVVIGNQPAAPPFIPEHIRHIEGWILGRI